MFAAGSLDAERTNKARRALIQALRSWLREGFEANEDEDAVVVTAPGGPTVRFTITVDAADQTPGHWFLPQTMFYSPVDGTWSVVDSLENRRFIQTGIEHLFAGS